MDFPIHIETISMELFFLYSKGLTVKFLFVFLSLKFVLILANSEKPGALLFAMFG